MKITEIPVTLHLDGRPRPPHLRWFRDGWRTLRLLLLYAPDYLYVVPGLLLFIFGILFQALLLTGPVSVFGRYLGVHWLALGCLFSLVGFQVLCTGAAAKLFAFGGTFEMRGGFFKTFFNWFSLEAGLALGTVLVGLGFTADLAILATWIARDMGEMGTTHLVFVATTVMALGVQVIFSSFFLHMLQAPEAEQD